MWSPASVTSFLTNSRPRRSASENKIRVTTGGLFSEINASSSISCWRRRALISSANCWNIIKSASNPRQVHSFRQHVNRWLRYSPQSRRSLSPEQERAAWKFTLMKREQGRGEAVTTQPRKPSVGLFVVDMRIQPQRDRKISVQEPGHERSSSCSALRTSTTVTRRRPCETGNADNA